jgi:hypothetical protein
MSLSVNWNFSLSNSGAPAIEVDETCPTRASPGVISRRAPRQMPVMNEQGDMVSKGKKLPPRLTRLRKVNGDFLRSNLRVVSCRCLKHHVWSPTWAILRLNHEVDIRKENAPVSLHCNLECLAQALSPLLCVSSDEKLRLEPDGVFSPDLWWDFPKHFICDAKCMLGRIPLQPRLSL